MLKVSFQLSPYPTVTLVQVEEMVGWEKVGEVTCHINNANMGGRGGGCGAGGLERGRGKRQVGVPAHWRVTG